MITVYTKPGCNQCRTVFKSLDKAGIEYAAVDVSVDDDARQYIQTLGYTSVPIIDTGTGEPIHGFRPDRIKQLGAA